MQPVGVPLFSCSRLAYRHLWSLDLSDGPWAGRPRAKWVQAGGVTLSCSICPGLNGLLPLCLFRFLSGLG